MNDAYRDTLDEERQDAILMLQCAADLVMVGWMFPRIEAVTRLGTSGRAVDLAYSACDAIGGDRDQVQLLSAAALLEETQP
jgi:hypothetical protein